jgi:hypothetical protein
VTGREDEAHPIPDCVRTGPLWLKAIAYPIYGFCAVASRIMEWRKR